MSQLFQVGRSLRIRMQQRLVCCLGVRLHTGNGVTPEEAAAKKVEQDKGERNWYEDFRQLQKENEILRLRVEALKRKGDAAHLVEKQFASGDRINLTTNFYCESSSDIGFWKQQILEGNYSVLCDVRQSGKSSLIRLIEESLVETDFEVLSIEMGHKIDLSSPELFWHTLTSMLSWKYGQTRFPTLSDGKMSVFHFMEHFKRKTKAVLIVDEASLLSIAKTEIVVQFLETMRDFKQNRELYSVHSVLLVGVATLHAVLIGHNKGRDTANSFSPFVPAAARRLTWFTGRDISQLLRDYVQNASLVSPAKECLDIADIEEVAEDIYSWTAGHKGQVGYCLATIQSMRICSFSQWQRFTGVDLLERFIGYSATFNRCITTVKCLTEAQTKFLHSAIENGFVRLSPGDLALCQDVIAVGLMTIQDARLTKDEGPPHATVLGYLPSYLGRIATPLLRQSLMCFAGRTVDACAPPPNSRRLDLDWLVVQLVRNMSLQKISLASACNADGQPSEWAFQYHLFGIASEVLRRCLPELDYFLVPEARANLPEAGENKKDRVQRSKKRMDVLATSKSYPCKGLEYLRRGTPAEIDEHLAKAGEYSVLFGEQGKACEVVVVNFCLKGDVASNYYGGHVEDVLVRLLQVVIDEAGLLATVSCRERVMAQVALRGSKSRPGVGLRNEEVQGTLKSAKPTSHILSPPADHDSCYFCV